MFVIVGWLICIVCVFGVFIIHGGNISVVLKALPFELITIGGATVGAFVANNQMKVIKATATSPPEAVIKVKPIIRNTTPTRARPQKAILPRASAQFLIQMGHVCTHPHVTKNVAIVS